MSLGPYTDLAVLRLSGSAIDTRDDHLIVRTPANPDFHWGNCLHVTDPDRVDDPERWVAAFRQEFPDARHRAIGLVTMPEDPDSWHAVGLALETHDVLTAAGLPRRPPLPAGYQVRPLEQDRHWASLLDARAAQARDEGAVVDGAQRDFLARHCAAQRDLTRTGHALFLGAFAGDALVASLGLVLCGEGVARYQDVLTDPRHRRRGLAAHLLGAAARWSRTRGCGTWVIVAEEGSAAARLYRAFGFTASTPAVQAHRGGARSSGTVEKVHSSDTRSNLD